MAGLGRRSQYRKHLTDSVLHDLPEPQDDEKVAKVLATRGGNQFDILVDGDKAVELALLPTKFHKLVWVKRGDYVLVQVADSNDEAEVAATEDSGGIRFMISHILYKEQVKHLMSKGLWPDDPEFSSGNGAAAEDDNGEDGEEDGIVYQDYDEDVDDDLFVNTNRMARLEVQDSSDEDSSDGED